MRKPRKSDHGGAIITPDGKRHPIKPLTPGKARKVIKPYAQSIGAIAIHWNWLHENLSKLFELVVRSPDPRLAQAVWYAAESDFVQRSMLKNSLKYATHLTESQKDDIAWILNKIEKPFRHKRNAAIHAPLVFAMGIVDDAVKTSLQALFSSESPRVRELVAVGDLKEEFDHYGMIAERLADFVRLINRAIQLPSLAPWPEKPDLQRMPHKSKGRAGRKVGHKPDPTR